MPSAILYKSEQQRGEFWQQRFAESMPELEFRFWPEVGNPAEIKYLVAWLPPDNLSATFPNLEVVFSVGAGVDHFDLTSFPPQIKLVRMLDPQLVQGMVEYLTLATLAVHRQLPAYIEQQQQKCWQALPWIPAQQRRVGVMGLGTMGSAVIGQLQTLGFSINGWSRNLRTVDGITSYAGSEGLKPFLNNTDILICLLPLTDSTRHIINAELIAQLPPGASIINAGRGGHLVENDLLAALNSGHIHSVILDVMQDEPPANNHPFWNHPRVLLTPHIAGVTSFESGCQVLMSNINRYEKGEEMQGQVKISRGY